MRLAALVFAALFGVTATAEQLVYDIGDGVTVPVVIREVKPAYTPRAMREKIQGRIRLRAVVLDNGRVGDVEVTEGLDPELDQQAIDALKQWEFKPGTRDGKPVAVRVTCDLTFVLRQ